MLVLTLFIQEMMQPHESTEFRHVFYPFDLTNNLSDNFAIPTSGAGNKHDELRYCFFVIIATIVVSFLSNMESAQNINNDTTYSLAIHLAIVFSQCVYTNAHGLWNIFRECLYILFLYKSFKLGIRYSI